MNISMPFRREKRKHERTRFFVNGRKPTALFDAYGAFDFRPESVYSDYYLYDLSLSEIAENRKISRAAVSDALGRATPNSRKPKRSALLAKSEDA
jgi:DNA-directed RNA polymerase specialized sigma subunit